MQNAKDITLRLLIVDDSAENAEAIVSTLRNSGIAVRPFRPQSPDELVQAVGGQPLDLVLAANAYTIPQSLLTQQVAASGKDIPMILLADQVDAQLLLDASANGIRAIALRTEPDTTWMQRATTRVISWLPLESQL